MSSWIQHVKDFSKKNNISYKSALSNDKCKAEYKKIKGTGGCFGKEEQIAPESIQTEEERRVIAEAEAERRAKAEAKAEKKRIMAIVQAEAQAERKRVMDEADRLNKVIRDRQRKEENFRRMAKEKGWDVSYADK